MVLNSPKNGYIYFEIHNPGAVRPDNRLRPAPLRGRGYNRNLTHSQNVNHQKTR